MAQATFSVRMDETLKKQFDSLCAEFGMNTSTAINVFAKAVVRERKIPFEIGLLPTTVSSAELLNQELAKGYADILAGRVQDVDSVFNKLHKEYGI